MADDRRSSPVKVFVSYSHHDVELWEEFRPHLEVLQSTGLIAAWHDGALAAGSTLEAEIRTQLETSSIVLLLISAHYLTSKSCLLEAERALELSKSGTNVVIPVILNPVSWQDVTVAGVRLGSLKVEPTDGKPVTLWNAPDAPRDLAHMVICKAIHAAAEKLTTRIEVEVHRPPAKEQPERRRLIRALVEAEEVNIIGLTNSHLAGHLKQALDERRGRSLGFWQSLTIVFASAEFLERLPNERGDSEDIKTASARHQAWLQGKREVFQFLLSLNSEWRDNWSCREYQHNLPFVGVLYTRAGGGQGLRIAHILPGRDMREALYIELEGGTPLFEQTAEAIRRICKTSRQVVEWILLGTVEGKDTLRIEGLVDRRRLGRERAMQLDEACHPVVLIMLHLRARSGSVSILQRRNEFNASSAIGKYSNISGWVTDLDLLQALNVKPSQIYFRDHYEQPSNSEKVWDDLCTEVGRRPILLALDPPSAQTKKMWQEAAVREIREELGLQVAPKRLLYRRWFRLARPELPDLLFGMHSLRLEPDELAAIRSNRPYADLHPFGAADLEKTRAGSGFNDFLQKHFDEAFLEIFRELEILP